MPWQPDWRLIEEGHDRPPPGYAAVLLSLTVVVEGATERAPTVLFSQPILGSRLVEGSLQTVEPGEEVRIKGRAKWTSEIVSPLLNSSGNSHATVQVDSLLSYLYPPDGRFLYLPSRSAEPVPVRLSPPD